MPRLDHDENGTEVKNKTKPIAEKTRQMLRRIKNSTSILLEISCTVPVFMSTQD